jgi:hypothetical protein
MSMEYDRRDKQPAMADGNPTTDSKGGQKEGESLTPPTQATEMRKQIADRAFANQERKDSSKESKDGNSASQASEQQRNRDLWKK